MKKVVEILKGHIGKDDGLLKSGFIFLIGSLLGAVLNYLYHIFMGRMLGPQEYGVLGSLFAIIYLVTFFSQTFNRVVSKYAAEFQGQNHMNFLKRLIQRSILKILLIGALGFIFYVLISPYIASFMKIEETFSVILVGVIAYLSLINSVFIGALNGLQKFVWQNISSSTSVFLKFSLAVILVFFGFEVNGALIAILIGIIASILISIYPLRKILIKVKSEKFDSKRIYTYIIPVFFASFVPMLIITFDQILVKHFFSSAEAGYYAAAGTIAKIIWFGSGFFVWTLFPKVSDLAVKGKDVSRLLIKCMTYTSILAALGISAYFVMPNFIVKILYGTSYLSIAPLIGVFGFAMGLFSVVQVLVTHNLAIEKYDFIWIMIAGFIIEVIGISLFHGSLFDIIKIIFGVNLLILAGILIDNKKELGVNFA